MNFPISVVPNPHQLDFEQREHVFFLEETKMKLDLEQNCKRNKTKKPLCFMTIEEHLALPYNNKALSDKERIEIYKTYLGKYYRNTQLTLFRLQLLVERWEKSGVLNKNYELNLPEIKLPKIVEDFLEISCNLFIGVGITFVILVIGYLIISLCIFTAKDIAKNGIQINGVTVIRLLRVLAR